MTNHCNEVTIEFQCFRNICDKGSEVIFKRIQKFPGSGFSSKRICYYFCTNFDENISDLQYGSYFAETEYIHVQISQNDQLQHLSSMQCNENIVTILHNGPAMTFSQQFGKFGNFSLDPKIIEKYPFRFEQKSYK